MPLAASTSNGPSSAAAAPSAAVGADDDAAEAEAVAVADVDGDVKLVDDRTAVVAPAANGVAAVLAPAEMRLRNVKAADAEEKGALAQYVGYCWSINGGQVQG